MSRDPLASTQAENISRELHELRKRLSAARLFGLSQSRRADSLEAQMDKLRETHGQFRRPHCPGCREIDAALAKAKAHAEGKPVEST